MPFMHNCGLLLGVPYKQEFAYTYHFQMRICSAFSCPASSCPAVWSVSLTPCNLVCQFHVLHFQRTLLKFWLSARFSVITSGSVYDKKDGHCWGTILRGCTITPVKLSNKLKIQQILQKYNQKSYFL